MRAVILPHLGPFHAVLSWAAIPVLAPRSDDARQIVWLMYMVAGIGAVIFISTGSLIVIAMIRSRGKRAVEGQAPPEGAVPHPHQELYWLIGPVFVVLWIGVVSIYIIVTMIVSSGQTQMSANTDPSRAHKKNVHYDIQVIAHRWFWEFRYPGRGIVTANDLHIPIGRKLVVKVNSDDVVHSFWAPQLGRKMDAIPGRDNYLHLSANQPGTYQGFCSEYCGPEHAWMLFNVIAQKPAAYKRWLAEQEKMPAVIPRAIHERRTGTKQTSSSKGELAGMSNLAQPPSTPGKIKSSDKLIAQGRMVFESRTCLSCHSVGPDKQKAHIGPDLTHFASRTMFAGGVRPMSTVNVEAWLRAPNKIKPGTRMPTFKFTNHQLKSLTAYLMSLK